MSSHFGAYGGNISKGLKLSERGADSWASADYWSTPECLKYNKGGVKLIGYQDWLTLPKNDVGTQFYPETFTSAFKPTDINGIYEVTKNKPKKSLMSKLTTMFKKLLDLDTQILIEGGILLENLELTDDGEDELMALLFEQNKTALISLAKERIAAAKK